MVTKNCFIGNTNINIVTDTVLVPILLSKIKTYFCLKSFNKKHIYIASATGICERRQRFITSFANTEDKLGSKKRNSSFSHRANNGYSHENPFYENKSSSDIDFVQAVWVFHRHGDRTPARSLVPDHKECLFFSHEQRQQQ